MGPLGDCGGYKALPGVTQRRLTYLVSPDGRIMTEVRLAYAGNPLPDVDDARHTDIQAMARIYASVNCMTGNTLRERLSRMVVLEGTEVRVRLEPLGRDLARLGTDRTVLHEVYEEIEEALEEEREAGSPWGFGPGHMALPHMRAFNRMTEMQASERAQLFPMDRAWFVEPNLTAEFLRVACELETPRPSQRRLEVDYARDLDDAPTFSEALAALEARKARRRTA